MHVIDQHNATAFLSKKGALVAIGGRLGGPRGCSGHGCKEKYPCP
jgi:hypothetical protein